MKQVIVLMIASLVFGGSAVAQKLNTRSPQMQWEKVAEKGKKAESKKPVKKKDGGMVIISRKEYETIIARLNRIDEKLKSIDKNSTETNTKSGAILSLAQKMDGSLSSLQTFFSDWKTSLDAQIAVVSEKTGMSYNILRYTAYLLGAVLLIWFLVIVLGRIGNPFARAGKRSRQQSYASP